MYIQLYLGVCVELLSTEIGLDCSYVLWGNRRTPKNRNKTGKGKLHIHVQRFRLFGRICSMFLEQGGCWEWVVCLRINIYKFIFARFFGCPLAKCHESNDDLHWAGDQRLGFLEAAAQVTGGNVIVVFSIGIIINGTLIGYLLYWNIILLRGAVAVQRATDLLPLEHPINVNCQLEQQQQRTVVELGIYL